METWKPIDGFPGYEVSDCGRIRTYLVKGLARKFVIDKNPQRLLKQKISRRTGYCEVTLCLDGKKYSKLVHRLVLENFIGPCPKGLESCHNDGTRSNNNINNLRWDTRTNNNLDIRKHGKLKGENHPTHKLTEREVKMIRTFNKNSNRVLLGKIFGVCRTTIYQIIRYKNWTHI